MATQNRPAAALAEPTAAAAEPAAPPEVPAGLKGRHEPASTEVTAAAGRDAVFEAARVKAPSLTREFADAMGLHDEDLARIARGEVPPPPTIGPVHTTDLYLTAGGTWQQTPPGVAPQDVGKDAIAR